MIERNGDLVFCDAFFMIESEIVFEDLGIEHPVERYPFRFRLDELQCFYGDANNRTAIFLKSGISFSLDIPLDQFDEFIRDNQK
jgi:hypothetical protein